MDYRFITRGTFAILLVGILVALSAGTSRSISAAMAQAATPAATADGTMLEGKALVQALQQGGYVIFFRHANTDTSQTDADSGSYENCKKQRNLNDKGRATARAIGQAFDTLKIPIAEVLVSPYCRTRDTAGLAFGHYTVNTDLVAPLKGQEQDAATKLQSLLSTAPDAGTNIVLVSHASNLTNATKLNINEGEAAIFQPNPNGSYSLVARVLPEQWVSLAASAPLAPMTAATSAATAASTPSH
jgi:phosphohistidine phosphatase SixA